MICCGRQTLRQSFRMLDLRPWTLIFSLLFECRYDLWLVSSHQNMAKVPGCMWWHVWDSGHQLLHPPCWRLSWPCGFCKSRVRTVGLWLTASKKLSPGLNSANTLSDLGSRPFPSQVSDEAAALADTLIELCKTLKRGPEKLCLDYWPTETMR